jgi:xylose isomerase
LSCKKNLNTQTTVFLNQYTDFNKPISFWTTAIIPTPVPEEPRKSQYQYAQHTLAATIWKI